MLVAKKRLPAYPLKIVGIKSALTPETKLIYKVPVYAKKTAVIKETKPDLDQLPFNKWMLPPQEEGYIKGKENDFL